MTTDWQTFCEAIMTIGYWNVCYMEYNPDSW